MCTKGGIRELLGNRNITGTGRLSVLAAVAAVRDVGQLEVLPTCNLSLTNCLIYIHLCTSACPHHGGCTVA